jgi:tRNA1Val (adenine37-N6)-methyltransferase
MLPPEALSRDVFLDGRLAIWQPLHGYRAATDPILLAASVGARAGERVLELGCGTGVALLALAARVPGLALHGVERNPDYGELAQRNAAANGCTLDLRLSDLAARPAPFADRRFDQVFFNPPYFPATAPPARDAGRRDALREETPLELWIDAALRRLEPGGYLTMINRVEPTARMLSALEGRAGAIALRPITAREGQAAGRVLLRARKGARGPFRLLAPLVMHAGRAHPGDHDHFTPQAQALLRAGAALDWD